MHHLDTLRNGQNSIIGYQADQSITVKISDIDKSQDQLEKILDGAVNNGANEIQVLFSVSPTRKIKATGQKKCNRKCKAKREFGI